MFRQKLRPDKQVSKGRMGNIRTVVDKTGSK